MPQPINTSHGHGRAFTSTTNPSESQADSIPYAGSSSAPATTQDSDEVLYVNPKQYVRILHRRRARARLDELHRLSKQRKPYLHESRHKHAMRRPRGPGGRFLTAQEIAEQDGGGPQPSPASPTSPISPTSPTVESATPRHPVKSARSKGKAKATSPVTLHDPSAMSPQMLQADYNPYSAMPSPAAPVLSLPYHTVSIPLAHLSPPSSQQPLYASPMSLHHNVPRTTTPTAGPLPGAYKLLNSSQDHRAQLSYADTLYSPLPDDILRYSSS